MKRWSQSKNNTQLWMWELDCEESWALKNWCFWTVILEKTLESPWTARRSNQSILKEISPGWMASPTRRTWVWVNSGSWWWIGRPGVLQLMGLQRVRHDWVTELNWSKLWWPTQSPLEASRCLNSFFQGTDHSRSSYITLASWFASSLTSLGIQDPGGLSIFLCYNQIYFFLLN